MRFFNLLKSTKINCTFSGKSRGFFAQKKKEFAIKICSVFFLFEFLIKAPKHFSWD